MNKTASYLSDLYKNNDDFILREINNGKNNIYVVYFESLCDSKGIDLKNVTAFGDDMADIGSMKLCGTGVAMGNAQQAVKDAADITIGSNDEDGIADYLESLF